MDDDIPAVFDRASYEAGRKAGYAAGLWRAVSVMQDAKDDVRRRAENAGDDAIRADDDHQERGDGADG